MEKIVYENKEICRECGGKCCKKCGCDYSIENFDNLNIDNLQKILKKGEISIVSYQNFKYIKGKLVNEPYLYLRARNINRPIVDLLSLKTTCASLSETGCKYSLEERPKGGVNLIPVEGATRCYPEKSAMSIIEGWKDYQKTLSILVKRFTGKGVNKQLEEDIYNLMIDVMEEKFDGVSPIEIEDINRLIPLLKEAYPNIYEKALEYEFKQCGPIMVKKLTPNNKR